MDIADSVALVTGANRGIGEAFVRVLLAAGARKVYAGSRDPKAASVVAADFPGCCEVIELDVTDGAEVTVAAEHCADITLLVNNAGVFTQQRLIGAVDMSGAREEMEVNYFGTLAMCRAFAPVLANNGGGRSSTCYRRPPWSIRRTWAATDHPRRRRARSRPACARSLRSNARR